LTVYYPTFNSKIKAQILGKYYHSRRNAKEKNGHHSFPIKIIAQIPGEYF
jgi:hypothetical protein